MYVCEFVAAENEVKRLELVVYFQNVGRKVEVLAWQNACLFIERRVEELVEIGGVIMGGHGSFTKRHGFFTK